MTKQIIFDDPGDLSAPPGSKSWAMAVRLKLQSLLDTVQNTEQHIDPYLNKLEETGAYKQLTNANGKPFGNPLEFYEAPYPYGLNGHVKIKERIARLREPGRPQPQFEEIENRVNGDNNHSLHDLELPDKKRGTTGKSYILARLKRDHPATFESYLNGEFPSARQAGIAAGFVKDVKRIQVLPIPKKIAAKIKEFLTPAQIQELIRLLQNA